MIPEVSIIGFVISFLLGLTSLGGGSLLTPILVLWVGINPSIAVGSDLVYQSITRLAGLPMHLRQRSVDWRVLRLLAAGSIPGTLIGGLLLPRFHLGLNNSRVVLTALGVALVLTALLIVFQPLISRLRERNQGRPVRGREAFTVAAGLFIGLSVAVTSVGAGSFAIVGLMLLYPTLNARRLVGTDFTHGVILLPISAALAAGTGRVDIGLVAQLLVGAIPGVILGSRASGLLPERPLRLAVAGLLMVTGVHLVPGL
jgi:uncharacterized protein